MSGKLYRGVVTKVQYKRFAFYITDAPSEQNAANYAAKLKRKGCVCVVRVCEPTYSADTIARAGMEFVELPMADGACPDKATLDRWLDFLVRHFPDKSNHHGPANTKVPPVAVHCVAGLGRAPLMVAIALMEAGQPSFDAIEFVRKRRRGSINQKQIQFLEAYKPRLAMSMCSGCVIL